jgi:peptide/nickel transport system ATP-binding protein
MSGGEKDIVLDVRALGVELQPWRKGEESRSLLQNICFYIRKGEIVGLVGQSGCGKSLTSLVIAGFLPGAMRMRGSILLNGFEVAGARERELNKRRGGDVAIVFQEPSSALDPLMTIGRQIELPLKKHHGLKGPPLKEALVSLMKEVKLDDIERIARSFPFQVSGGQRQRAAIAVALACSPTLLIADEPTSSMDAGIQKQLVELIRDIAIRKNIAVLFISHDIAIVREIARRILVMKDGHIVEEVKSDVIEAGPKHEYTRLLIRASGELENALRGKTGL